MYKIICALALVCVAWGTPPNFNVDERLLEDDDYVGYRINEQGLRETLVSWRGIHALETTLPVMGRDSHFYRYVTDGAQILSAVYASKGVLEQCHISTENEHISAFARRVFGEGVEFELRDVTEAGLASSENDMINFHDDLVLCQEWRHNQNLALKHHGVGSNHIGMSRSKRSMMTYPGTLWCGVGTEAENFEELGHNSVTDLCCRSHDFCPYVIEGFTKKYNYFNYRFHTLSHCQCDQTFRSCLKSAGSNVANMVGNIFFNTVRTECFILNQELACKRRSWWGKCEETERKYTAEVKKPLEY